jgi:hypothetical protein
MLTSHDPCKGTSLNRALCAHVTQIACGLRAVCIAEPAGTKHAFSDITAAEWYIDAACSESIACELSSKQYGTGGSACAMTLHTRVLFPLRALWSRVASRNSKFGRLASNSDLRQS